MLIDWLLLNSTPVFIKRWTNVSPSVFQFPQPPFYVKDNAARSAWVQGFTLVSCVRWDANKPGADLRSLHLCEKVHDEMKTMLWCHCMFNCDRWEHFSGSDIRRTICYILVCGASSRPVLTLRAGNNGGELKTYNPSNQLEWLINFGSKAQTRGDVVREIKD